MGNFISNFIRDLDKREISNSSCLTNISLSKINEFYRNFEFSCDSFSINLTEFEQIFGNLQNEFHLWDTDHNGLIDSIEIFTGISIYSEAAVEEKFHFLFDLVDFNKKHAIGYYDLIFLFETFIQSVLKMHKIAYNIPIDEIENFVVNYSLPQKTVNFENFKRILCENNEILKFFKVFRITPIILEMTLLENNNRYQLLAEDYKDFKYNLLIEGNEKIGGINFSIILFKLDPFYINDNKRFENYRKWIYGSLKKITNYRNQSSKNIIDNLVDIDYCLKLKWVYGIKLKDETKYPICYIANYSSNYYYNELIKKEKNALKQSVIVYTVGKLVIILNIELNHQQIYTNHQVYIKLIKNEVISFAVSSKKAKYIASSEICMKPAIHIWRSDNLETLTIIKGYHRRGVHLMSFSVDNKFLITCGMKEVSPILIFEWKTIKVIFSMKVKLYLIKIDSIARDLKCLENFRDISLIKEVLTSKASKKNLSEQKNVSFSIIISSKEQLFLFNFDDNKFQTQILSTENFKDKSDIICIFCVHNDTIFNKMENFNSNKREFKNLYILCGHINGSVTVWNVLGFFKLLIKYKSEIINISSYHKGIIIATLEGNIYIWDNNLTEEVFCINIFEGLSVISKQIKCISVKYEKLLICSYGGDVIEINTSNFTEIRRINNIVKIECNIRSMTTIKELPNLIFYGGDDRNLTIIDRSNNEIADIWPIEHIVNCIDGIYVNDGMFILAVGCQDGLIRIRKNWEHFGKKYKFFGEKQIFDIKFCKDPSLIIVCCEDKNLYFLNFDSNTNEYKIMSDKPPISFKNSFPFSINFNIEYSKMLVNTYQSKFNLVDFISHEFSDNTDQVENLYWVNWETKFPVNPKFISIQSLSLSLGVNHNFIVGSDELNSLHLWKDVNQVESNISSIYRVHSSTIQSTKLSFDDKTLFTAGFSDKMISMFLIENLENDPNAISLEYKEKMKNNHDIYITDMFLVSEIKYAQTTKLDISSEKLKDNNILIRGFLSKKLNNLFTKNFTEIEESTLYLPPQACINISHIYGSHICEKRNSVKFVHLYNKFTQNRDNQKSNFNNQMIKNMYNDNNDSSLNINDFVKMYDYNKNNKEIHSNCTRNIIYFNSRFIILKNPLKSNQIIYQGHKHKVGCVTIHPDKKLIASGEISINPSIYVWNIETLETIKILKTGHLDGILHLAFSKNGKYLVSIGNDLKFSMQIFLFEQSFTLNFINVGEFPIFEIKFFNFNEQKFITSGYRQIIIWKIKGNVIKKKKVVLSEELNYIEQYKDFDHKIFTCFDFIDFEIGTSIETDILIGSNFGDICGISCDKYFVLKPDAHIGTINCIKVSDMIKDRKFMVFTTGEDGLIKIWDQTYNLLSKIDVFSFRLASLEDFKRTNKGVQSLDLFFCEKGKIFILVGLRSGDLLEIEIKDKSILFDSSLSSNDKISSLLEKCCIVPLHIFSYPYYLKKGLASIRTLFCLHPYFPIVAIFSGDQTIRLFDYLKNKIVLSSNLGYVATAASFSADGKILAVGLINGYTALIDSFMKENKLGGFGNDYLLPRIDVLNYIKENNIPLEIKFSSNGELLAISYDNKRQNEKSLGGSYVAIFLYKTSKLNNFHKKLLTNQNNDNLYIKLIDIFVPHSQYEQSNINKNDSVCTSIDFSEDSLFVLLSNQRFTDSFQKDSNETIFIIWDITNNQLVVDQEMLLNIKFPSITASNAMFAKNLSPILNQNVENDSLKDLAIISTMCNLPSLDLCLGGNLFGEINIFRNAGLYINYKNIHSHSIEDLDYSTMTMCRTFSGHSNEIIKIQSALGDKFIFTCGMNEQCIIQWNLLQEDLFWDLDFFPLGLCEDPFTDLLNKDEYDILCKELWTQRNDLIDIFNNKEENTKSKFSIDLQFIIGRRAYDRRNNLKYDANNRIVYTVSSYIVYLKNEKNQFYQDFLIPEEDFTSNIQKEISCFCLSDDKQYLAVGLSGTEAEISIWQINTSMNLNKTIVPQCTIISILKFNYNQERLVGVGINKFYTALVFIIENTIESSEILAVSLLEKSIPFKIKDIEFQYQSKDSFISVGIQHFTIWSIKGNHLEYANLPLSNQFNNKENLNDGKKNYEINIIQDDYKFGVYLMDDKMKIDLVAEHLNYDTSNYLKVSFLNIVCYKHNFIMGADDGGIYIFDNLILSFKVNEHVGPVTAIDKNYTYSLILTGGSDGNMFLWKVDIDLKERVRKLIKIKSFPIKTNANSLREILIDPFSNIQSVSIGMDKVCVGTRSGDIYEFNISDDDKKLINSEVAKDCLGKIQNHDHDPPISISIDSVSKRLFALTYRGTLIVWDIEKLELLHIKEYKINSSQMIYHFKFENKVLIAFESNIIVVDTSKNDYNSLPYDIQTGKITDIKISPDEKILAVASISNSNPQVDIYDIKMGFTPKLSISELNASVKFLDFSLDSVFLLIEDNLDETHFIDIFNKKRYLNTGDLNFEIEWCSDGLRYSEEKLKSIHKVFNNTQLISKIAKHPNIPIVAIGDVNGSIRLFNYPSEENESYIDCRTDHCGKIDNLIITSDQKYLISSSNFDRTVFIYRINNN